MEGELVMHTFYFLVIPVWLACMLAAGEHGILATVLSVSSSFVIGFAVDTVKAYRLELAMPSVSPDDFLSWSQQRKLCRPRRKHYRHR